MTLARGARSGSTVDDTEVARFSALAAEWWNPRGKMAVLHKFNPIRLNTIKQAACRRFGRDEKRLDALSGLRILDIGCGGGVLSEPLARLGASVVGADPATTISKSLSCMPRSPGLRSTIGPPRPKPSPKPASASTSCWPWKWSST